LPSRLSRQRRMEVPVVILAEAPRRLTRRLHRTFQHRVLPHLVWYHVWLHLVLDLLAQ
jgi:hypothetical protein